MTLKNEALYVPSVGFPFRAAWLNDDKIGSKNSKFFGSNGIFNHSALLDNAYYCISEGINDYRETFGVPSDMLIIGDSGGFQIAQAARKNESLGVDALDILKWLERNCDIGMNLDIPPVNNFDDSLKQSIDNFRVFETRRQTNTKLYNVLHGGSYNEITRWYDGVKNFEFDGWAIGVKPITNLYLQLLCFLLLYENDAHNMGNGVHYFGMTSLRNMIGLSITANHFNIPITFDSSTYSMGSRAREVLFPLDVVQRVKVGRNEKRTLEEWFCKCPVCREVPNVQKFYSNDKDTPNILSLHNMYQYVEVNKIINICVKDRDVLEDYARSVNELNMFNNFYNILDLYDKKGIDAVYSTYSNLINEDDRIVSSNIFGYE